MEHRKLLYVGGLDSRVDENTLTGAFIPFGPVKEVEIPLDPVTRSNRGFGFVRFHDAEDAEAARDNMNNAELHGRTLKVDVAKQQKTVTTKQVRPCPTIIRKHILLPGPSPSASLDARLCL